MCCRPSIAWALLRAFGVMFLFAGVYKLVNDVLIFAGPILLKLIIQFVQYRYIRKLRELRGLYLVLLLID